jgi:hypothetical protein
MDNPEDQDNLNRLLLKRDEPGNRPPAILGQKRRIKQQLGLWQRRARPMAEVDQAW